MAEIGAQGGKIGGPKRAKADGVPALRQAAAHGAGRRKRRKEGNLRSASLHQRAAQRQQSISFPFLIAPARDI
jgi:hypothetical protein